VARADSLIFFLIMETAWKKYGAEIGFGAWY